MVLAVSNRGKVGNGIRFSAVSFAAKIPMAKVTGLLLHSVSQLDNRRSPSVFGDRNPLIICEKPEKISEPPRSIPRQASVRASGHRALIM